MIDHDEIMRQDRMFKRVKTYAPTSASCIHGEYKYTGTQIYGMTQSGSNIRYYQCQVCRFYHLLP